MPVERTSATQKVKKTEREARKAAIKQEVLSIVEHLHETVDAAASKLDMTAADLLKATQLSMVQGRKDQPVTLWNACIAHARERASMRISPLSSRLPSWTVNQDDTWAETLLVAQRIRQRVERVLSHGAQADADAREEVRIVQEHLGRLRARQAEARIPATKAQTERGASSQVTHTLNRVQREVRRACPSCPSAC